MVEAELLNPLTALIGVGAALGFIKVLLVNRSETELDAISEKYFDTVVLTVKKKSDISKLKAILDVYYEFKETRKSANENASISWITLVSGLFTYFVKISIPAFSQIAEFGFYLSVLLFTISVVMLWKNSTDIASLVVTLKETTQEYSISQKRVSV